MKYMGTLLCKEVIQIRTQKWTFINVLYGMQFLKRTLTKTRFTLRLRRVSTSQCFGWMYWPIHALNSLLIRAIFLGKDDPCLHFLAFRYSMLLHMLCQNSHGRIFHTDKLKWTQNLWTVFPCIADSQFRLRYTQNRLLNDMPLKLHLYQLWWLGI